MIRSIFTIFFIVLFSCSTKTKSGQNENTTDTLKVSSLKVQTSVNTVLDKQAKSTINNWLEFNEVEQLILKYHSITITDALNSSEELCNGIKNLKKNPMMASAAIKVRINVLLNHALRLNDMMLIPSISDSTVTVEIHKLNAAYDSVISKINSLAKTKQIDSIFHKNSVTF